MPATADPSQSMKNYWKQVRALAAREKISVNEARQRVAKPGSAAPAASNGHRAVAAKSNGKPAGSARREAVSRDQLADELRRLAQRLGRSPTQKDIEKASKRGQAHSVKTYRRHFKSLGKALAAAGVESAPQRSGQSRIAANRSYASAQSTSGTTARPAMPSRLPTPTSQGRTTPANQFERAFRFVTEIGGIDQARLWVDCVEAATRVKK